jgi:hypothetical protein
MNLLEKMRSAVMKRVALAAAIVGGFLALAGAGTTSAHARLVVSGGIGRPVYVGARPVYVRPRPYYGPAYIRPRYAYYHRPRVYYWDVPFDCRHYR